MIGTVTVTCPSCFEQFAIPLACLDPGPAQIDYDCEICCRPMILDIDEEGEVEAIGLGD